MGLFDKIKDLTVNEGINRARTEKDAVLLDIRTREAYRKGHVAGTIHIPLDKLEQIKNRVQRTDVPIYVIGDYDHSPKKAARQLKKMGYTKAVPSGIMEDHHGLLKK